MSKIETKSRLLGIYQPKSEHITRSPRGKSGELQQLWDALNYQTNMADGGQVSGKIHGVSVATLNTAGANNGVVFSGENLIPYGWKQASLSITPTGGGATSTIIWTAVAPGIAGNDIKVEYVNNGGATAVDWSAPTNTITVGLNIAGPGDTATNVLAALAASASGAQYVVQARALPGGGAGIIDAAVAATNLTGGLGRAYRNAALTIDPAGANNAILFTAAEPGSSGNSITVAYTTGLAVNTMPIVTVAGSAISVQLRAGATIANDVVAAINSSWEARRLISAKNAPANNGTGSLPGAVSATNLAGGSSTSYISAWAGGTPCSGFTSITDTTFTIDFPAINGLGLGAGDTAVAHIFVAGQLHTIPFVTV